MKNVVSYGLLILAVFAINGIYVTFAWAKPDEDFWDMETPMLHDDNSGPSFYCGNLVSDGVTYITDVFGT
ncbi:MAG: hypothetical protein Q7U34_08275, partial [Anaerolineales bacterium]|nr:hypothetical protein [Anaerolineales bacterium]